MRSSAGAMVLVVVLILLAVGGCNIFVGAGGWGPTRTQEVMVQRTYVDYSGSGDNKASHYMVATDKGLFEVDNGLLLGIWNADEVYGRMQGGKRYRITTKGNKVVGMFFQEYPYIVASEPMFDGVFQGDGSGLTNRQAGVIYPSSEPLQELGKAVERPKEYVYDMRGSNVVPLVVILKDGTKIRYGE